jgi:hypothetical protein
MLGMSVSLQKRVAGAIRHFYDQMAMGLEESLPLADFVYDVWNMLQNVEGQD